MGQLVAKPVIHSGAKLASRNPALSHQRYPGDTEVTFRGPELAGLNCGFSLHRGVDRATQRASTKQRQYPSLHVPAADHPFTRLNSPHILSSIAVPTRKRDEN